MNISFVHINVSYIILENNMFDEIDIVYTVGESVECDILLWKRVFWKKWISFDPVFASLGFM